MVVDGEKLRSKLVGGESSEWLKVSLLLGGREYGYLVDVLAACTWTVVAKGVDCCEDNSVGADSRLPSFGSIRSSAADCDEWMELEMSDRQLALSEEATLVGAVWAVNEESTSASRTPSKPAPAQSPPIMNRIEFPPFTTPSELFVFIGVAGLVCGCCCCSAWFNPNAVRKLRFLQEPLSEFSRQTIQLVVAAWAADDDDLDAAAAAGLNPP